jgi:hypothetical protein
MTEILEVSVDWYWGYGNQPALRAIVDLMPKEGLPEFIYQAIPDERGTMLISKNNAPWHRFVYVEHAGREGQPQLYGALGGEYRLTDGSVFKTRTGWSSREGVINARYREYIEDELVDCPIRLHHESGGLVAFVSRSYLDGKLPEGVHLIRDDGLYLGNEVYWIPSIDPDEVIKAPKPPNTDRYGRAEHEVPRSSIWARED